MVKVSQLQIFQVYVTSLCTAFHARLIAQSRDHHVVSPLKTEHEILIYDQQSEWTAPQNDRRRTEKQKVTRV